MILKNQYVEELDGIPGIWEMEDTLALVWYNVLVHQLGLCLKEVQKFSIHMMKFIDT